MSNLQEVTTKDLEKKINPDNTPIILSDNEEQSFASNIPQNIVLQNTTNDEDNENTYYNNDTDSNSNNDLVYERDLLNDNGDKSDLQDPDDAEDDGVKDDDAEDDDVENDGAEDDDVKDDDVEDDGESDSDVDSDNEEMDKNSNKDKLTDIINIKTGNVNNLIVSEDEDDDGEDSSDDDNEVFQKLEQELEKDVILDYHPESKFSSYNEVLSQCKIIRNKNGEIIDKLHTTIPFLTKYEKARILGVRAKQINNGSEPFINIPNNIIDGVIIAEMEMKEKKLPFIIRRPLPNGGSEYWRTEDLEILED